MPGRDGLGPLGQGAFTERGMTTENGSRVGTGNGRRFGVGLGRGIARGARFGLGLGLGYGCRRMQERQLSAGADQETLNREKAMLQRRLKRVTDQLSSLSENDK